MNQEKNPYSAPKAKLEAYSDQGGALWREGKILVCRRDTAFPERCVKCNEPAQEPLSRFNLRWHHGAWYLLILLNLLLYVIVAMFVRKSAVLEVGLCAAHRRRRLLARVIGWGGLAAIVLCFVGGGMFSLDWLFAAGGIAILPWAIASVLLAPQIRAARIDEETLRVKGCGRDFLATLPEYTE